MCGISGILRFDGNPPERSILRAMTDRLAHRGPDGSGIFTEGPIGLGHRRLAIIDLSKRGKQPMHSADGRLSITFNGEIYNFRELREELEHQGVRFSTETDTEVILQLYAREGAECVRRLRGMFAFAIWDSATKRLFLARDRVGKKPLYYTRTDREFIFGSELKAVLAHPSVRREISALAQEQYLAWGYVPAPHSIFAAVRKLRPAHTLTVQMDGSARETQYWNLAYAPQERSIQDWRSLILQELETSTKLRMTSDVPLGAFLSGGIDSSAIVALMSRSSDTPIKTFSIGFEEQTFNELPHAKIVADAFGTEHTEFVIQPRAADILPSLIWHYDEPFADSSALPSYHLAKLTRSKVTVALNGDGGDESFAGYERYAVDRLITEYRRMPRIIRSAIATGVRLLPEPATQKNVLRKAKRFVEVSAMRPGERYERLMSIFPDNELLELTGTGLERHLLRDAYNAGPRDALAAKMRTDILTYLPDDLLVKMDRATMAHSLEARSPFLDHRVMEIAASIPSHLKLQGFNTKHILKRALAGILPKSILQRKKQGFGVPLGAWFRGELRNIAHDVLLSPTTARRGLLRQEKMQTILREHCSKRADHSHRIWSLLWLELWYRMYAEDEAAPARSISELL